MVLRGLAAILATLSIAAPAAAQSGTPGSAPARAPTASTQTDPNALQGVTDLDTPPPLRRLTGRAVRDAADRLEKIIAEREKFPGSYSSVFTKGSTRWQVSYYARGKPLREIAQVIVDDTTGAVLEAWTGPQVAWTMARGYPGAFGRKVNSPFVWVPLAILFVAPFVTPRRPWRLLHLDLLVLVGFSASVAFFNDANLDASVPIVAPLLAYLLARMLWIGLRRRPTPLGALPLLVPASWLAIAVVFLVGFRVGLNITSSNVIDVGYAGVIGADRLVHGEDIYGNFPKDNEHGDTYGPVTYAAYVPFELALPWNGRWDDLPAAHAAAITFDLACLLLCFLVGRRIRGPGLGWVLAYAWASFPFTLYAANTNSNDALVAVFALLALLVAARPLARGAMVALGGLSKFGMLGIAPLMATHGPPATGFWRRVLPFTAAFAAVALVALAPVVLGGESLATAYDRTIGFQAGRDAPFSIWGLYDIGWPQTAWQIGAVVLAVALAFVPRRRDLVGLAALSAAVLIALQIGLTYWFYLYVVWFFPLAAVAFFGRYQEPDAT